MTDVWHLPAIARWEKSCGKHPTQKPLGLLARIIEASTVPRCMGPRPFSGSSTTGIAANLLGRKFLGLEIEEEYLAMSRARREEIENADVRTDYLRRLAKSGSILPPMTSSPLSHSRIMARYRGWKRGETRPSKGITLAIR